MSTDEEHQPETAENADFPEQPESLPEDSAAIDEVMENLDDEPSSAELPELTVDEQLQTERENNLRLLAELSQLARLELPLLVGLSRKSLFGKVLDRPVEQRLAGSLAAAVIAAANGADIIRVHDVPETVDAMRVLAATVQHS